jgi:hypothetical protein
MEISITKGLRELKLYNDKIKKAIRNTKYVQLQKSNKKINNKTTVEEFTKQVKADLDSIKDMIKIRNKIKAAIVNSNATTIVTISGNKMTVAEAIEKKENIKYDKTLLQAMKDDFVNIYDNLNAENHNMEMQLDRLLQKMCEGEQKNNEDKNEFSESFKKLNEWKLVDPINIEKQIKYLEEEIDNFESEVDIVLSESNTITKVNIED